MATSWIVQQSIDGGGAGIILDPFAGSGTTLGEALRLGHRAIGVEVNPFAVTMMKSMFHPANPKLESSYRQTVEAALEEVSSLYGGAKGPSGWFWGYETICGECGMLSMLLNRRILVQHAYPSKHPAGWLLCPRCREVLPVTDIRKLTHRCPCGTEVAVSAHRSYFRCNNCEARLRPGREEAPPSSVLVAVERQSGDGSRSFGVPTPMERVLAEEVLTYETNLERVAIARGKSTEQILRWGWRTWDQLFHPRQRALAWAISRRVREESDEELRVQLALAFSPLVEYHCRLASFKGLGTGAVRQAFGRPVLHPPSISYEVNPLGAADGRLLSGDPRGWYRRRARGVRGAVAKLMEDRGGAIRLGTPLDILSERAEVAVLCADSADLDLPENSVDAIVTDPPYFDRVHYDDLAGGFNAWLQWCGCGRFYAGKGVQTDDVADFEQGIRACFGAALRALKDGRPVVFTFHHDDVAAWGALARAFASLPLVGEDVVLLPTEMPNALIKYRARRPIACDAVLSFVKGRRAASNPRKVECASRLALDALHGCPELLSGDVDSAAYAAGVVTGLACDERLEEWEQFLGRVLASVRAERGDD